MLWDKHFTYHLDIFHYYTLAPFHQDVVSHCPAPPDSYVIFANYSFRTRCCHNQRQNNPFTFAFLHFHLKLNIIHFKSNIYLFQLQSQQNLTLERTLTKKRNRHERVPNQLQSVVRLKKMRYQWMH